MTATGHYGKAASSYVEQEILSETPLALIARIYSMAAVELSRARACLASRNLAAKGVSVRQASRCLSLLQCSLNREEGGEVAANLDRIYGYLLRRLTEAHVDNNDEIFAEIQGHLAELGSAWREIAERTHRAHPAPSESVARPAAAVAP